MDHHLESWIAKHLRIPRISRVGYELQRRSLDARRKPKLEFIYQLTAEVQSQAAVHEGPGIEVLTDQPDQNDSLYQLPCSTPYRCIRW